MKVPDAHGPDILILPKKGEACDVEWKVRPGKVIANG